MDRASFNRVVINGGHIKDNFALLKDRVGRQTEFLAMVKSDAYGHGLIETSHDLAAVGCRTFGVAELGEGVSLRESGCTGDILVFLGFDHTYVEYLFSHQLTPVLFTQEDIQVVADYARSQKTRFGIYLKFDCGMSRLGFKPHQSSEIVAFVDGLETIDIRGIMSHYPCSDERTSQSSKAVFRRFSEIVESIGKNRIGVRSLCNSGGLLYLPQTHGEMVRAGISLYGYYPDGQRGKKREENDLLTPAMSFVTRVLQINEISEGTGVSYGHIYKAENDMKLAVLPVGYSNGYPRSISNKGVVLIHGKRAPIRGRICMNLCMVDVTDIDGVVPGDEVVMLGSQGDEMIDADEIAGWAKTISYEILCSLGNNNQRLFA